MSIPEREARRLRTSLPPVLAMVGNTPLLRVHLFDRDFPESEVWAKAEWFNPGGSVKDRPALAMILGAEARGQLRPGQTIIDSTSGNTGVAYAMIGAALGYRVRLVMPENVSSERKALVRGYGAEVVFSDPLEGSDGAIVEVTRLAAADPEGLYWADQYSNPDNPLSHFNGTAVEIMAQTDRRLTHFVCGLGTSGTLVGVGRRLRRDLPQVAIVAAQPDSDLNGLEGLKHMPTAIVPAIYEPAVHDRLVNVPTEPAYELARRIAATEGLLVGHSSGAALWAVRAVLEDNPAAKVVTVFPDGGARYLSAGLYGVRP